MLVEGHIGVGLRVGFVIGNDHSGSVIEEVLKLDIAVRSLHHFVKVLYSTEHLHKQMGVISELLHMRVYIANDFKHIKPVIRKDDIQPLILELESIYSFLHVRRLRDT